MKGELELLRVMKVKVGFKSESRDKEHPRVRKRICKCKGLKENMAQCQMSREEDGE